MSFQVVRRADGARSATEGSSEAQAVLAGTPIPGVRVEIHADIATTPIAIYEVITDKDGNPASSVVVDSASNIRIKSKDETIAKFDVAGAASEFIAQRQPTIVATPMVEQGGACLRTVEGTPVVEFKYNNFNTQDSQIPVTSLNPDLYGTPTTPDDDLLLNSIRNAEGTPTVPVATQLAPPTFDKDQLFKGGSSSFSIPFDPNLGALTWYLLGQQTRVDGATQLCEGGGTSGCTPISTDDIYAQFRGSVSGTLKLSAKFMKRGRSPYLKTTPAAIIRTKVLLNRLAGAYRCPENVTLAAACVKRPFPVDEFIKSHDYIFSKPSPVQAKAFEKLRKAYTKRYRNFLLRNYPKYVVVCPK
jgi:hypothetical protein